MLVQPDVLPRIRHPRERAWENVEGKPNSASMRSDAVARDKPILGPSGFREESRNPLPMDDTERPSLSALSCVPAMTMSSSVSTATIA